VDSPSCPQCGARFGDPVPVREASPPPEPPHPRPPAAIEPAPEIYGRDEEAGPWGRTRRMPGGDRPVAPDPGRLLLAMIEAAARARRGRPGGHGYEMEAPRRRRGGGCLGRLLMLALLLFALLLLVPALLGALLGFR
jgi:hypothetical protein